MIGLRETPQARLEMITEACPRHDCENLVHFDPVAVQGPLITQLVDFCDIGHVERGLC